MKTTQTRIVARRILLSLIVFTVVLAIAALFIRSNITRKLAKISDLAQGYNNKANPEEALLLLRQAEDDFQASLLDANSKKSIDYKTNLLLAFNKIDTLLRQSSDTSMLNAAQRQQTVLWYHKKVQLSQRLFVLKREFDSLLTVYSEYSSVSDPGSKPIVAADLHSTRKTSKQTDTLKQLFTSYKQKGLFGRLKDAIANKPKPITGVVEINHNSQTIINGKAEAGASREIDKATTQKIKQLQQSYGNLMNMQLRLILLNSNISNELERIVNEWKDIHYQMTSALKDMAFKNYQETTSLLNKFYLSALFLILLFAVLLIIFILQLGKAELLLRKENERSVSAARAKMDLLLHMSHEIRNPLTAIQGFLYVFSKTSLSERQSDMLKSIQGSSDMLLRTLNDTLDAAKMEHHELKINDVIFNPYSTIQQVVESSCYSAEKKQLSLRYNFIGNKDALVSGDDFRLKQVVINLVSNAIKYTAQGSINVRAELQNEETLQVDITDTGAGISAEQLPGLFSKYYQTSSSKGQIGTGLGLFICKQLVEMQGGKISVRSTLNKGTTFSFFITYRKQEPAKFLQTKDPLAVLNGVNILAVDDNELNLMMLKFITSKWNVNFHQALNAMDALRILAGTPIDLVLTDIQMPEINGYQLLKAILNLPQPRNRTPVIAASGISKAINNKELEQAGFSGFISKPFVEDDLAEVLVKALKKGSFKS